MDTASLQNSMDTASLQSSMDIHVSLQSLYLLKNTIYNGMEKSWRLGPHKLENRQTAYVTVSSP